MRIPYAKVLIRSVAPDQPQCPESPFRIMGSIQTASRITSEYAGEGWPYSMSGLHFAEVFWGKCKELSPHLLEDLFDALNELAPEGIYFGASEGDGSDFGYWEVTE